MLRRRASLVPADVTVARADMSRRAGPRHARNRPALRPHQILQVLAHRLFVAQVVMLLHQAVEQRLIRAAPHLHELQRLDLAQTAFHAAWCRSAPAPVVLAAPAGCAARTSPAATRSGPPGPASATCRGTPCRARRHWAASTARLHTASSTACAGSRRGARRSALLYKGCLRWLISRPRYLSSAIQQQYEPLFSGTQGGRNVFRDFYFSAFTRRHIGAARTRDTSPAAISNCAS